MSHLDEPVDRASMLLAARLTASAHDGDNARGCQCCTPDGCVQDAWARQVLAGAGAAVRTVTPGVVVRCLGCADGIVVTDHHCAGDRELKPYGGYCGCTRPGCGPGRARATYRQKKGGRR